MASASLDLNETQNIFVPADEVDFSMTAGRSEVTGHHHIAQSPEIKICILFPTTTGVQMSWDCFGCSYFAVEPIKAANHAMCKSAGHKRILGHSDVVVCDGYHNERL